MWEAKTPVSLGETPKRIFRKATLVKKDAEVVEVVKQPLRRLFRPTVACKANWDEALAEAIAAGTSKKVLSRPMASKADWDAALLEAISKSKLRMQRPKATPEMWRAALEEAIVKSTLPIQVNSPRYDPAVLHPVFFTSSLVSSVADTHPAAIGHVVQLDALQYDAAVLHPVFFAPSLVSSIADIHPTAIGHVVRSQTPSMWTVPLAHTTALEATVGSMWKKGKVAAAQFEHDKTETKRSIPVSKSANLPILESASIWQQPQSVSVSERNWIVAPKLTRAQNWMPTTAVPEVENTGLWKPKSSVETSSPDIFAQIIISPMKKVSSRPPALQTLNSNELFNTTSAASNEAIHWLHTTSTSMARTAPSAGMWMASKKVIASKASKPDMFSHIKAQPKKPTTGRPAPLARLNSNELFSSAEKLEVATHWLHSTSSSSSNTPIRSSPVTSVPAPQPIKRSQTWTTPGSVSPEERQEGTSMWSSQPIAKVEEHQTMFSNPHTEPWNRKKRSDSGVEMQEELESKEMWSRKWVMPESPKRWLEGSERRVSKVQFRY
jgi:hypothetical protein